ncbi:hypothetical protein FZC84_21325 [Rossellomorea vietnamensis]|uniref:Uncharacterized protein n=1 Tax=Rossellomorea vietnamensis TaxID=218284 RepID=A0A5D4M272_9BACI|nr:hypothetical protein [Rossellomorea vietnamensis]TYR95736.1 hypothetical protein FZC84_21325 [Rossellomorea vietnamensis]
MNFRLLRGIKKELSSTFGLPSGVPILTTDTNEIYISRESGPPKKVRPRMEITMVANNYSSSLEEDVLIVDAAEGSDVYVQLPDPTEENKGMDVYVKKLYIDGRVIVYPETQNIDEQNRYELLEKNQVIHCCSTGTKWIVLSNHIDSIGVL